MRGRNARSARMRGFSLVEGLICLAVMLTAATVAMPNVARWLRDPETAAALRGARDSAGLYARVGGRTLSGA